MDNELLQFYKKALQGVITEPLCQEYIGEWRKCNNDKEKLIRLAMRQQSLPYLFSHCYTGNGVSKEYIQTEFADYINGKYTGIDVDGVDGYYKTKMFVGYNDDIRVLDDVLSFQWCNINRLQLGGSKAVKLYCGCGSQIHIECDGYNTIIGMLFDDSKLFLDDIDENTTVHIYKYSEQSEVIEGKYCLGRVKVFNKKLRL